MTPRTRCVLALAVVLLASSPAPAGERLAVVVHPTRSSAQLTIEDVAQIYLKRRRFWEGDGAILPVNRDAASGTRLAFTQRVFAEQAHRLATYWNRQYFQGVLPPATLASDEAVKRFVAIEPNAIGYIDASTVDDTVKVVLYLD